MTDFPYRVIDDEYENGDVESLVDVLSMELAVTEAERDQLVEEGQRQRREIALLRCELGETDAALDESQSRTTEGA